MEFPSCRLPSLNLGYFWLNVRFVYIMLQQRDRLTLDDFNNIFDHYDQVRCSLH